MSDRAGDELAIRQLIAGYCHTVDGGRFDEFEQLWDADAVLEVMGRTLEGREAIREWIEASQPPPARGIHATFEPLVDFQRNDRATVETAFVFFATRDGAPTPTAGGRYLDEVAWRAGDGWRFTRRTIVLANDPQADPG